MKEKTIERIRKFTEDRDWDQFHSPANLAKSIVMEKFCVLPRNFVIMKIMRSILKNIMAEIALIIRKSE